MKKSALMPFSLLVAATVLAALSPMNLRPRVDHVAAERFGTFCAPEATLTLAYPRRAGLAFHALAFAAVGPEAAQTLAPGRRARVMVAGEKAAGAAFGGLIAKAVIALADRLPHADASDG